MTETGFSFACKGGKWRFDEAVANGPIMADAIRVLEYVSRGRGHIGVTPYPDALARRVLAALHESGGVEG